MFPEGVQQMRTILVAVVVAVLWCGAAMAGGNGSGFGAGVGSALPQAEMQRLCIDALRREMAGGPPAPLACSYQSPAPSYVAPVPSPPAWAQGARRCVTRPNIPGSLGTVYETTCY
jgi:hypothetical protein